MRPVKKALYKRAWALLRGCYLCGAAAGTLVAVVALNMEEGLAKHFVFGVALLLFVGGRLVFAVDRELERRKEDAKRASAKPETDR